MVKFSSKVLLIVLIAVVTISCEQQQDATPMKKSLNQLTDFILSSSHFIEIGVDATHLNVNGSHFTSPSEEAVVIPFEGRDGEKFVMALLNEQQQIRKVFTFEAITDVAPENVLEKIEAKQFTGSFKSSDRSGFFQIDLVDSKIVSKFSVKNPLARIQAGCGDWTAPNGPLGCAGARIESLNWLDKSICYIVFAECLAQTVASCIIDDCVVSPQTPNP